MSEPEDFNKANIVAIIRRVTNIDVIMMCGDAGKCTNKMSADF